MAKTDISGGPRISKVWETLLRYKVQIIITGCDVGFKAGKRPERLNNAYEKSHVFLNNTRKVLNALTMSTKTS